MAAITGTQSRAASLHESMYSNRVSFIRGTARKVGSGTKVSISAVTAVGDYTRS